MFLLLLWQLATDTAHVRRFMQASAAVDSAVNAIVERPRCEVDQIQLDVGADQMRVMARITRDHDHRLYLDFAYVRDATGWRRYPLTRAPRRSFAPCYVDGEWSHLPSAHR